MASKKNIKDSPFYSLLVVLKSFFRFFEYITLGAYYLLFYVIIMPLVGIYKLLENVYYQLFTSKSVKKQKKLKLNVNFDSEGNEIAENNKSVSSQMQRNRALAMKNKSIKNKKKLNSRQREKLKAERDILLKAIMDGKESRFEKPQTFKYKAMDSDGKIVFDTFIGVSKLEIYTFLTSEGYTVYSIETSKWINFLHGESMLSYKKMSTKDLIFFITQLATYIKSGITLTEAMRILSKQMSKNKNVHRTMQSVVYYLTMGESFSNALDHQGSVFPSLVINMIKAAEAAGNIEETLDDLGQYYTEIDRTRKQMISAISYPAFIGIFSIGVVIFIMVSIIPKFIGIYESAGAELTGLTKFVITSSDFLKSNITTILIVIVVIIFILYMLYKNVLSFKIATQILIMRLPIIGKIVIYNELTIFTKTFASLLRNDVFITDSIQILSNLTNNEIYKDIMLNTISNIAKGERISESFKDHWAIPDVAYYMIVTGENTGELATMMSKVSTYYQEQHSVMVNSLKSLIEPAMIIFLAVVVGGILIATILPIFNLYNNINV